MAMQIKLNVVIVAVFDHQGKNLYPTSDPNGTKLHLLAMQTLT